MAEPSGNRTIAANISRNDASGESVTGTLSFSDQRPANTITLSGVFPSDSIDLEAFFTGVNEIENYPLLHLQTAEGFFTAIDSRVIRSTQNLGGSKLSEKVLLPRFLIRGSVLLREHELGVTDATVRFWDQDEWAQCSSWKVKNTTEEDPDVTIVQMARPTVTAIVNGATISLKDQSPRAYFPIGNREVTMRQSRVFRLTFDSEIPLKDFMRD
ncbi:hypothetical protein GCM10007382_06340 [Salinibacterium xinjiangense]|uniref:ApeA N-terminal domain-containing protein n=1 Tax=Salinibacterium xinjiangense TaxID=386302 RepID=A0A2C8ZIB6_9MICO|nr:hypothetical protein [Salinibacterium xinjiangense]GGK89143.1 hypothetical protein GCM10007382_06340 [Salinibacterium xinjiangense]SOE64543.1 hypothetical protein SAMN06296378_1404 [Salinibacterium xinjiangense]